MAIKCPKHSLLAAHRLQCPQPGTDQDEAGGREGGEIHDPAGAFVGSAVIFGAGGQGRLSLGPGQSACSSTIRKTVWPGATATSHLVGARNSGTRIRPNWWPGPRIRFSTGHRVVCSRPRVSRGKIQLG